MTALPDGSAYPFFPSQLGLRNERASGLSALRGCIKGQTDAANWTTEFEPTFRYFNWERADETEVEAAEVTSRKHSLTLDLVLG